MGCGASILGTRASGITGAGADVDAGLGDCGADASVEASIDVGIGDWDASSTKWSYRTRGYGGDSGEDGSYIWESSNHWELEGS